MNGNTIKQTSKILDIDRRTGSIWLKQCNENGIEGLIPNYSARGRKCRLSDEQLKQLHSKINEEGTSLTIKDAQEYISNEFNVSYSFKQAWYITRKKLKQNYGKPFLKYKERPENHKAILKNNIKKFVEGFINHQIFLAFMDQSYFQNEPNLVRILHDPKIKNIFERTGQKFGISVTRIMGVNCKSYMEVYERNNSYTTILTLVMFKILNMESKEGKDILKKNYNKP